LFGHCLAIVWPLLGHCLTIKAVMTIYQLVQCLRLQVYVHRSVE